ncbi:MAG: chemotaxis protein CheA [Deltaproteobacteria bacterium]|nr:chemotaxis protein CheA [Deltaproteobacteria bacterium]
MKQIDESVIRTIKQVGDAVSTLSLSDEQAWTSRRSELERVIKDVPEEMGELTEILIACVEGLEAVSQRSLSDVFSLVESLSDALCAAEQYLRGQIDKDYLITKGCRELLQALGRGCGEEIEETDPQSKKEEAWSNCTLDDIAALLVQLEPIDREGLVDFRNVLQSLIAGQSYPESVLQFLKNALQKVDEIIEGSVADPDAVLGEIGKRLEVVMAGGEATPQQAGVRQTRGIADEPVGETGAVNEQLDYLPEDADADILDEFIAEGKDLIAKAEEALLSLESDPKDKEAVGTVFRAFHTIKGNAAFLGLRLLSELAHRAESLLSSVRDGEISFTSECADLSLRSIDMFKELIQSLQNALAGGSLRKPEGYDGLMSFLEQAEHYEVPKNLGQLPPKVPRVGDILVNQGKVGREVIETAAATKGDAPLGMNLIKTKSACLSDVAQAMEIQNRVKESYKQVDSYVRVRTERLDRLIDMVGEMVIAHSMVAQDRSVVSGNNHDLLKKIAHTTKIARELQDLSMSMRMVPLKSTFQKMARLVRDLSTKAGKKVTLITEGDDTEVDRNMVDLINDPLIHMVRNSVDHGIEPPGEREKAGKPQQGTVRLLAYHSSGNVMVEIQDNGAGLNREAILAKAQERGIVHEGDVVSDQDVFNLIFEPGFSTAKNITDVSGRGVGMDVVKRNIESLRGHIEIQSEPGRGSTFKIRVPLTLAIIDGMVVRVGSEKYVIPTISIVRSIEAKSVDLASVLGKGRLFSLEGALIPVFKLGDLFQAEDADHDGDKAVFVVVESNAARAALLVDELLGQQQIVIKSLGETLKGIDGISGGAIMADGSVSLILDVGGVIKVAHEGNESRSEDP